MLYKEYWIVLKLLLFCIFYWESYYHRNSENCAHNHSMYADDYAILLWLHTKIPNKVAAAAAHREVQRQKF